MKKLNVAILSAWHVHAREYADIFANRSDTAVTCVWDNDEKRGKEFADIYSVDFEPSLEKLLARPDVDAVSITTSTNLHKDVMIQAANAGKHIFTEKVLAFTKEDCMEIKAAVEKNNVKFCISFPHRTHPHNIFAKEAVEKGIIGEVTLMRVRNAHDGAVSNWLPDYFYDEEVCGGGAMMDLGAHPMYLANWIMGHPKSVSSVFTSFMDKGIDDNNVSVIEYPNGAICISETGFVSKNSPFSLELYGTEGTIFAGGPNGGVQINSTKINQDLNGWISVGNLPRPTTSATDQFVNAVLHNGEIEFDIDEAVKLTVIMEAAYASYKEGKKITI